MEISSSSKFEFEKGKIHSPTPTRYFNLLAALGVCIFAYFHNSTIAYSAEVAPSAKFTDGMLSKTRPAGWLGEACKLQSEGLTGHPEALSYPYDTCLWDGEIPRMGTHGQDWWRYEQTAYYTDGLLRLGYAIGDEAFIKKGEEETAGTDLAKP